MALSECSECDELVSDKARVCPHCGAEFYDQMSLFDIFSHLLSGVAQLIIGIIALIFLAGLLWPNSLI